MADPFVTAVALRDAIVRGEISAEAAVRHTLDRITALDPILHAFLLVDAERAITRARALDAAGTPAGPLHGVPIALKDNIAVRGMRTTAGSRVLENYVSPFDATVVRKLEQAGAVIVGKTVCDEFAMGSSTEHCAFGPSRNPWATDRIPGGSSGGSAVAVAAGHDAPGARIGHRWIHPPARRALRHRRPQTHVRPRVTVRARRLCLVARSDRSVQPLGRRCGSHAGRAERARSA